MAKTLNPVDATYYRLLQDILANGYEKTDRTGTGTLSVFGRSIRFDCRDGKIPLLTTKRIYTKGVISELLWFLQGRTDLRWLLENDNKIWVGDALKAYHNHERYELNEFRKNNPNILIDAQHTTREEFINKILTDDEFSKKWGELGPIYGKQWRKWTKTKVKKSNDGVPMGYSVEFIDQLQNAINTLLTNPDSRRNLVTAWNPSETDEMILPPCHIGFQFYTRELTFSERCAYAIGKGWMDFTGAKDFPETHYALDSANVPKREISLKWVQRSVDVPLGLPFNIASYGLLLHIIGKIVNMTPGDLIGDLGDTHIYLNQIDGIKEQLKRSSNCEVPTIKHLKGDEFYQLLKTDLSKLSEIKVDDFQIMDYNPHPTIKMPLSN